MTEQEIAERNRQITENFLDVVTNQKLPFFTVNGEMSARELRSGTDGACYGDTLPRLNSKFKVVLDPSLTDKWDKILLAVGSINFLKKQQELGFLLIAEEQTDGVIYVRDIIMENSGERSIGHDADKLDRLVDEMKARKREEGAKPFLIFGHSHPEQWWLPNKFSNSWSLGDYEACYRATDRYKNDLQIANLLITPSLETNMMFFDRPTQKFYRFNEGLYAVEKNVHSYSRPVARPHACYSDINATPVRYNLARMEL